MNIDELRADLLKPQVNPSVGSGKPTVVGTLVAAIQTRDSGVLGTALNAIPKDKLKKSLADSKVLGALVDHYTTDTHKQLLKKGFDLTNFSEKILFTHIDQTGWSNILGNTPKTKTFDQWLQETFQETLDYDFQKIYPMCKKSAAEFRTVLQQHNPQLHDAELQLFFDNSEGVEGLMPLDATQFKTISKENWAWLKTIPKDSWVYGFEHGFFMEKQRFNIFLNFFGELPLAKQAMDDLYTQAQSNKKSCMGLFGNSNIRTSVLWGKLNTAGQNALSKELNRVSKPLQQLGLSESETLLHAEISLKVIETIEKSLSEQEREGLSYLTHNGISLENSLSFVHFLLKTADADTLVYLSASPKACDKLQEALSDPVALRGFTGSTYIAEYTKLFKKIPQLANWRDQHNNTILHYSLALNISAEDNHIANCVMKLLNAYPQLRGSNNIGVSLRDMCNAADAKLLADYDKKTIALAIKEAGISTNTGKTSKRKI